MSEQHVIKDGEYYVKVGGDDEILELQDGETLVPPRPHIWCDFVGGKWVENAQRKLQVLTVQVRSERDQRLSNEVDPIASNGLRWASLTPEKQQEWATYRQQLLDVSLQAGFPQNVTWPVKPQ
jgi:hypothetical protein